MSLIYGEGFTTETIHPEGNKRKLENYFLYYTTTVGFGKVFFRILIKKKPLKSDWNRFKGPDRSKSPTFNKEHYLFRGLTYQLKNRHNRIFVKGIILGQKKAPDILQSI